MEEVILKFSIKQISVKQWILGAVILVLIGVMIAANIVLNLFSPILHAFFSGDNTDYSGATASFEEGDKVVQELGEDSMVLLKNKDGFLPLNKTDKINLFGWAATDQGFLVAGGGSGGTVIHQDNKVTLTQALEKEGMEYNKELLGDYSKLSDVDADKNSGSPDPIAAVFNPPASFYTQDRLDKAYAYSHTAVVVLSRFAGENAGSNELLKVGSYDNGTYLELNANEKAMFDALENKGFDVIVLFNVCNNPEMGFLDEYECIKAALYVGVPGQSGARAIPRILRGDVSPSGRIADTLAYDYQTHNPSFMNAAYANDSMVYQEGIYVGYKWYETADVSGYFTAKGTSYDKVVQYPFGYGLSYTDFEWKVESRSWTSKDVMSDSAEYVIKVNVRNTGKVAGKEVVQLYVTPPYKAGGIEMPAVSLVAFAKTGVIQPKHDETVTLKFTAYDLASYDAYDANKNEFSGYETESGDYMLKLMNNSHDAAPMANSAANEFSLYSEGLKFDVDPVTKEKVENRFTGDTAYADCPVDASSLIAGGVKYLSRENKFANYPTQRAPSVNKNTANNVSTYRYDGYDNADISDIKYGEDNGYLLTMVKNEDGTLRRPTEKELATGKDDSGKTVELVLDEELAETLRDYDAPIWKDLLDQLTQDDVKNLIGKGGFQTAEIYNIAKPHCTDRDGPAGFNMGVSNPGTETKWTGFPTESLIGCSWNTELLQRMGEVQGSVALATGLQGWYAPGVNLHRSVYNTRNYEYFSEDTVLTGKLGAAIVKGAKSNNLYCYVKHLAVSEAGQNPADKNTWLTEQALRETYLRPFEMTVKEGGANGMMSAFNRVGAVWAGSNHALLEDILRKEWGFRGTVITDWYDNTAYMNYTRGVIAGNDLWLAGTSQAAARIDLGNTANAFRARQSAKNIIYTYITTITEVTVTAAPHSTLLVVLWSLINVVLAVGMAVCVLFIVLDAVKRIRNGKTQAAASASAADAPSDTVSTDTAADAPADVPEDKE